MSVLSGLNRIAAALQLHPTVRLAVVAALLSAAKVLLYTTGTTLFLSRQGIEALPILYLTLSIIATCISLLLAAMIDRAPPAYLLPGLAAFSVLGIVALQAGLAADWQQAPAGILIAAHVYDIITDIVFWVLAAALFDNLRLRRLTPHLYIAIAAGGSLAGIMAERALAIMAAEQLLWPAAGLVCVAVALFGNAAGGLAVTAHAEQQPPEQATRESPRAALADLRRFLVRHPFALCLALNSLLLTTVYSLTEFVAYAVYSEAIPDEAKLGRLLALLFAALQVAEFAVLWFGARGIIERASPMLRNLIFPLTSLACLIALLLQPRLGWAVLAHINTEAVSNGVFEPVNTTNYSALPVNVHGRARTLADGIFYPFGMAFAGLALTLLPPEDAIFRATLLALTATLFFLALNVIIARSYLPTLLHQLRHGVVGLDRRRLRKVPASRDAQQLAKLIVSRDRNERRLGIELTESAPAPEIHTLLVAVAPALIHVAPRLDDREWVRAARLIGCLGPSSLGSALATAIDLEAAESVELLATAHLLADLPMQEIGLDAPAGSFLAALLTLAVDGPPDEAAIRKWLGDPAVRSRIVSVVGEGSPSLLRRVAEQPLALQHHELKAALLAALARTPSGRVPGSLHLFIDDLRSSSLPQHRAAALRLMARTSEADGVSPTAAAADAAAEARFRRLLTLAWPALADPSRTVRAAAIDVLRKEPRRAMARIAAGGRLLDPALPADRARGLIELLAAIGDRPTRRLLRQLIAGLATGAERDALLLQRLAQSDNVELAPLRAAVLDHAQRLTELLFDGLAVLGDRKRAGQLREALREVDARLRAGTIDGLASLKHGVLARRFIPLLEQLHLEPGPGSRPRSEPATHPELLSQLAATGDRWLRAAVTLVRASTEPKAKNSDKETLAMQPMFGPKGPALTDSSALAGMLRLKRFELFSELPFDVLELLLHLLEERQFAGGALVQNSGHPLLHAWLIDTGGVVATWPGGLRESFGPEGCIGETALIDPTLVAPEIMATSQCRVFRLHRVAFQDLAHEHPVLIESLCRLLARNLGRMRSLDSRIRHPDQAEGETAAMPRPSANEAPSTEASAGRRAEALNR